MLIPVYNGEDTIRECIESVKKQDYKNIEIVVVDDGSDDKTYEILKSIEGIRVFRNSSNKGLGYTRNRLIKKCNGDFIIFLDSDDLLENNALSLMYDVLISNYADMVMGRVYDTKQEVIILNDKNKYDLIFKNIDKYYMIQQNKLFRKEIFKDLEYPDVSFADDEYMIHHILSKTSKIVIIPNKTYYYNEDGLLHKTYFEKYQDALNAFYDRYLFFKNTEYERYASFMLRDIYIYYYKLFRKDNYKLFELKKGYNNVFFKTKKHFRFRDIFFFLFPKLYCIIRNNVGDGGD